MTHFRSAQFELDTDDARRVVKLVRTPEPFHSVQEMVAALEGIMDAVAGADATYGLIVDNRNGPVRTDPGYQDAFSSFRTRLDARFARVGVVFASEAGIQQLEQVGASPNVRGYMDEARALAWAADGKE